MAETNGLNRDMEIQERENDLVLGSFGRSFYVLDNYAMLRELADLKLLDKRAHIFDIKKSLVFIKSNPLGGRGKASQGESYFTAKNRTYGSVIKYFFKDSLKTTKEIRQKSEKKSTDDTYPTKEQIRTEANEEKAYLLFVIKDENGNEIQKIKTNAKAGINEVVWNYRYATTSAIKLKHRKPGRYESEDVGQLALPGKYTVTAYLNNKGTIEKLAEPKSFEIELLNNQTLPAADKKALLSFQKEIAELSRSVEGSNNILNDLQNRLKYIKTAIQTYPNIDLSLLNKVKELETKLRHTSIQLYGDNSVGRHEYEIYPSINDRIGTAAYGSWNSTSSPTNTARNNIKTAKEEYIPVVADIKSYIKEIETLEQQLGPGVPYTPGRGENWKKD